MEEYREKTLRDYLRVLFRHKLVVIVTIVTVVVTVAAGLLFTTPVYESQVKMLISAEKQVESPYYQQLAGYGDLQLALTQSEIVRSNAVMGLVVRALGLYNLPLNYEKQFASIFKKPIIISKAAFMNMRLKKLPEDQRKQILYRNAIESLKASTKVEPLRDTNLFVISVKDYSPVLSAVLANAVSRAYVIFDLQQQLAELQLKYGEKHPTVAQLKDNIEKMAKNLNGEPLSDFEAIGPASVKVIEQANLPNKPQGLPKPATLLLAFVMSIFLGVMLAFICEYLDQSFRYPEDVEEYLNIDYLGFIPKNARLSYYHNLADQIFLLMKDKKLKTLMFASAVSKEGVTTILTNLGTYFSKTSGHKVLIVDANLRNPSMQKLFKGSDVEGLSDVLQGNITLDRAIKEAGSNLYILPAGKTSLNPMTLLNSHMMHDLLKHAKDKYDIVLVDVAPLNEHKDGVVLAPSLDGTVIVLNEGETKRHIVKIVTTALMNNKASVLGAVLNNRTYPIPEKIYKKL